MGNLKFIKDRIKEYNSNYFINEIFQPEMEAWD